MFLLANSIIISYNACFNMFTRSFVFCIEGALVESVPMESVFAQVRQNSNVPTAANSHSFCSRKLCSEEQRLSQFMCDINNKTSRLGLKLPIQNLLGPSSYASPTCYTETTNAQLSDTMSDFDLLYAKEEIAVERPAAIIELVIDKFDSAADVGFDTAKALFLERLLLSESQMHEIEVLCNGQSASPFWKLYKCGCISGSNVCKVCAFIKKANADPTNVVTLVLFLLLQLSGAWHTKKVF